MTASSNPQDAAWICWPTTGSLGPAGRAGLRMVAARDPEIIAAARGGDLSAARLTPEPLPRGWLDAVRGLRILCLACAGGQQAPVLAAAGADVTVFDLSEGQLDQDRAVARREGLALSAVQGDMRDLSAFDDQAFDVVFHPISNLYVPTCGPCGASASRAAAGRPAAVQLLQPGGVRGRPRSAIRGAGPDPAGARCPTRTRGTWTPTLDASARGEALVFGHTLQDQIGGQLDAGFLLAGFHEARQPRPRFVIDGYLPTFLATWAVKPA